MNPKQVVSKDRARIIETRRDLHRIPETGFKEEKTSAYVGAGPWRLDSLGVDVMDR